MIVVRLDSRIASTRNALSAAWRLQVLLDHLGERGSIDRPGRNAIRRRVAPSSSRFAVRAAPIVRSLRPRFRRWLLAVAAVLRSRLLWPAAALVRRASSASPVAASLFRRLAGVGFIACGASIIPEQPLRVCGRFDRLAASSRAAASCGRERRRRSWRSAESALSTIVVALSSSGIGVWPAAVRLNPAGREPDYFFGVAVAWTRMPGGFGLRRFGPAAGVCRRCHGSPSDRGAGVCVAAPGGRRLVACDCAGVITSIGHRVSGQVALPKAFLSCCCTTLNFSLRRVDLELEFSSPDGS